MRVPDSSEPDDAVLCSTKADGPSFLERCEPSCRRFVRGAVVILFVAGVELLTHHTTWARELHLAAYAWLHNQVNRVLPYNSKIVIVDTSSLQPEQPMGLTPREPLLQCLDRLRSAGAVAVGVDIDLSPPHEETAQAEYVAKTIPLFERALALSSATNPMPVFLGVHRQAGAGSNYWLWSGKYAPLAAGISWPMSEDVHRPELWRIRDQDLPMIGYCLALALTNMQTLRISFPKGWLVTANKLVHIARSEDLAIRGFLVEFNQHRKFENEAIPWTAVDSGETPAADTLSFANRVRGKAVLLGDVYSSDPQERVKLPGGKEKISGVVAHACSAETILDHRLYEIRVLVGTALSVILALLTLAIIIRFPDPNFNPVLAEAIGAFVLVVAIVFLSWMFRRCLNVVWLEWIVAIAAVFLHTLIGVLLHNKGHMSKRCHQNNPRTQDR